jgi:peptidoglycan/LPS O-acetylase OafA/YrhL
MSQPDLGQIYSTGIKEADEPGVLSPSSATLNAADRPNDVTEIALARKSKRIPALDFTKGALVVVMVLYHWMNYFVMADGSVYKYLRFLTPSFIFIAGFLISQVYLSKYQRSGSHVPGRLLLRGFKLLAIVVCLNLAQGTARVRALEASMGDWSTSDIAAAYLTGIARVAFSVLVPIAYLLILSAGLLVLSRHYRNIFHVACLVSVACALVLELKGIRSGYLQLVSIGMLGISVGYVPMDRINGLVRRPLAIFVPYLAYLAAITLWDDSYLLQVVGVSLSLAIIYWIGLECAEAGRIGKVVTLLGQYSLFAYIAQIVILQVLRRSIGPFDVSVGASGAAFLLCVACTIVSVEVLDRARVRVAGVDKAYTAVFG